MQDLNRHFFQVASGYKKRYHISLESIEMQMETTVR